MTHQEALGRLPEAPSRRSGRIYMGLIFALAVVEVLVSTITGYAEWLVIGAINALVVLSYIASKMATSADIHRLIDGVARITEAAKGGG